MKTFNQKDRDKAFEEWFTLPLDGFPLEIQKLLKETARVSFDAGISECLTLVNKSLKP